MHKILENKVEIERTIIDCFTAPDRRIITITWYNTFKSL